MALLESLFAGISNLLSFIVRRQDQIASLTMEHLWLVLTAMVLAVIIGVTVGILISYWDPIAYPVINITQIIMTIPSIAMIAILIPFFGIGFSNGVAALTLYALLPIVRNTYTGIRAIEPAVLESAIGMGMKGSRILIKIIIPLALPVIMAGIRTSVVMGIGIGAIAAFIGAGGLGRYIFDGILFVNYSMVWAGAIFISLLAILADILLGWSENKLSWRSK